MVNDLATSTDMWKYADYTSNSELMRRAKLEIYRMFWLTFPVNQAGRVGFAELDECKGRELETVLQEGNQSSTQ